MTVTDSKRMGINDVIRGCTLRYVKSAVRPFEKYQVEQYILDQPLIREAREELRSYPAFDMESLLLSDIGTRVRSILHEMRDNHGVREVEAVFSGGSWFWYPVRKLTLELVDELISFNIGRANELMAKAEFYKKVRKEMVKRNAKYADEVWGSVMEQIYGKAS